MVKPVDEIPMSSRQKSISQRDLIRDDIRYAIDNGIEMFEFVGDYNYKYLRQYAKEIAVRIISTKVTDKISSLKKELMTSDELYKRGFYVATRSGYEYKNNFIFISSYKGDDHPRVFCKIDFSEFDQIITNDFMQALDKARNDHYLEDGKWIWKREKRRRE